MRNLRTLYPFCYTCYTVTLLFSWQFFQLKSETRQLYNAVYDNLPSSINSRGPLSSTANNEKKELDRDCATLEIILCTHVSVDKLDRLSIQQEAWKGPMSVAVYITSDEDELKYKQFRSTYHHQAMNLNPISFSIYREQNQSLIHFYPHNILRNLAIQHATSDYILSLDADFLPSRNTYTELTIKLRNDHLFQELLQHQTLYILPVFALIFGITLPSSSFTRDELVVMHHNQTVNKWHYAPGHARVLYEVWIGNDRSSINHTLKNDFSYVIESNPEFEPYFLCYRPGLPKYWENFRGFGFDKSSFTQELALKKYEFRVLWDYFVVHLHHERERDSQDRNGLANRNGNIWWNEFTPYLLNKYQPKGMDERFLYPRFLDYYRISRQRKDKK